MQLMAPTYRTLQQIAEHADSAAVFAAAEDRKIRAIVPRAPRRRGPCWSWCCPGSRRRPDAERQGPSR